MKIINLMISNYVGSVIHLTSYEQNENLLSYQATWDGISDCFFHFDKDFKMNRRITCRIGGVWYSMQIGMHLLPSFLKRIGFGQPSNLKNKEFRVVIR